MGDYFIHSYHFGIQDGDSRPFLILHTYSRHGNACYGHIYRVENVSIGIFRQTEDYLRVS
jgi:hypothetical protein